MTEITEKLLSNNFVRVNGRCTAEETLTSIFDAGTNTLRDTIFVVMDDAGAFLGLADPRDLLAGLHTAPELISSEELNEQTEKKLLAKLATPISTLVRRDIPALYRNANLATMVKLAASARASALPLFDNETEKKFLGIIPVTAIFNAVCELVISAESPL